MQGRSAVALGSFDGLHAGHRAVLKNALSLKDDGFLPCVLLFDVHPAAFFSDNSLRELMTAADKDSRIRELGLEPVYIAFSDIRDMTAEQFIREILVGRLNAGAVCCGYNYRFGAGAAASTTELKQICAELGLRVLISDEVDIDGAPVSSTRIRALIEDGKPEDAQRLLGRPFSYKLTVVGGYRRGRILGAPTINQNFPHGFVVPRYGVYISETVCDGEVYRSVTNIGRRPTITDNSLLSETHIFNFSDNLYGRDIEVRLLSFLRPEVKFSSLDELSRQIKIDAEKAKGFRAGISG